jgi:acetylornithine deacetylase/succinyl-diaminopimelate desuccinylase-like protein
MENAIRRAEARFDTYINELSEYLRIPSISTLPEHTGDMRQAAEWTAGQLRDIGLSRVEIFDFDTAGHPVVYGEWLEAPGAPTVLIYGHYDVQPVDPLDEWDNNPFEPVVRDNHIVARGAADDKGMVYINLKAIQALMEAGGSRLPLNVKFLIEGEEEIGSKHLDPFIEANLDLLSADFIVISDSTMLSMEQPAISVAFRGITYVELEVRGPAFDLHSGQHGGVVHNPIQALCEIIAALHNSDGSVAIEGFYDRVRPVEPALREELAQLYNENEFRAETGAPQSWGEEQFNLRERIVARPTLEINGILGGWTGTGRKTVLPARAVAKISCRLVPDQDPYEIESLLRRQIEKLTLPTVRTEVRALGHSYPVNVPTDSEAMRVAVQAYERGFGAPAILMRKGGSLPVISTFSRVFGVPIIAAGYGLPSDRVHGPNERFHLECLQRGIVTAIALYDGLGKLRPA